MNRAIPETRAIPGGWLLARWASAIVMIPTATLFVACGGGGSSPTEPGLPRGQ